MKLKRVRAIVDEALGFIGWPREPLYFSQASDAGSFSAVPFWHDIGRF
jgi:hypothetical protein